MNGKIYRIVLNSLNYNDARRHCQRWGGDLAVLRSANVRQNVLVRLRTLTSRPTDELYFFGLSKDSSSLWRWVDNTLLLDANTNWHSGEPNNVSGIEDCGTIYRTTGRWNDISCNLERPFICERSKSF